MIDRLKIKEKLEKEICGIHGETPDVEIVNNMLQIATCCDDFHLRLNALIDVLMDQQMKDKIDDKFRKA